MENDHEDHDIETPEQWLTRQLADPASPESVMRERLLNDPSTDEYTNDLRACVGLPAVREPVSLDEAQADYNDALKEQLVALDALIEATHEACRRSSKDGIYDAYVAADCVMLLAERDRLCSWMRSMGVTP